MAAPVSLIFSGKQTFAASASFTPAATPTDIISIVGAANKIIRIVSLKLVTTNTAAGSQQYAVIKRSTVDTGGTTVAATAVPLDSNNGAASAIVVHWTANAGALGTAVGTINTLRLASPVVIPGSFAGVVLDAGFELLPGSPGIFVQPVTLRTASENLNVNFAGAALVAGQTHAYTVIWTEE